MIQTPSEGQSGAHPVQSLPNVGLLLGWYFGDYPAYAAVGLVFGWLGGLLLGDTGDRDGHH